MPRCCCERGRCGAGQGQLCIRTGNVERGVARQGGGPKGGDRRAAGDVRSHSHRQSLRPEAERTQGVGDATAAAAPIRHDDSVPANSCVMSVHAAIDGQVKRAAVESQRDSGSSRVLRVLRESTLR